MLQLRQAMRIGILANRSRFIVRFERLIDVAFVVGEIEDTKVRDFPGAMRLSLERV